MTTSMSVSDARAALPEVLDRVAAGEEITLTRHGRPVAVVVRPDRLRARRAAAVLGEAERIGRVLDLAQGTPLDASSALSPARADELVAGVERGRDRG